jgi:serine/threonine protein phosphatase 1
MATIAIGDIHGHRDALDDVLSQLTGLGSDDTVVFLGDYIDRGPHSRDCIETILAFRRDVAANVVCLCGNHEDWMLQTMRDHRRHSWITGMEAFDTIRSYSPDAERVLRQAIGSAGLAFYLRKTALPYEAFFDCVPRAHIEFFESLQPFHQNADCVCVHGGLDPRVTMFGEQTLDALIWGTRDFPGKYEGSATIVFGHWNNAEVDADGWPHPRRIGRTIGIDTIAHGVLTAVRMPDGTVIQSRRYEAYPPS